MNPAADDLRSIHRLLVIDSATEACSVALFAHGALVAGESADLGRGHAERLVPMIAALPDRGQAKRIMVNLGPGSFTGIRVGIAAARALGVAWDCPVGGYGCLDLVAAMAREIHPGMAIDVVMTGGHGEWFVHSFDAAGSALGVLNSLSPTMAIAQVRAGQAHPRIVAGSQADAVGAQTGAIAIAIRPDARAFGLLDPARWSTGTSPVYGRSPDARLPGSAMVRA